jgi:hypothetical protein
MRRLAWLGILLLAAGAVVLVLQQPRATADNFLQYGFETRDPIWIKGTADAPFKEISHQLTDESAHNGQRSELIALDAQQGTYIYYTFDLGRAPITDDLTINVWVKANRPGIQLLCRVVLPRERAPGNLDQPLTTLIKGDAYQLVGRWQQLTFRQPTRRMQQQQQLLRGAQKRDINIADAYVDQLVLNVYGGPGETRVYTDDLEAGPLEESKPAATASPTTSTPAALPGAQIPRRAADVQLRGNQLFVAGQRFFLRAIRHTGTPLKTLHDAGFNTVFLDETTPPGLVEDAINLGFWIVPTLQPPEDRPGTTPAVLASLKENFGRKVSFFLNQEAVLAWDLGTNLSYDQFQNVSRTAGAFRAADPMRPVVADVWDGFERYSRVDQVMLGLHRWPLMTSLEMGAYRDWLFHRRALAQPGSYTWTWVQTHLPDWYMNAAFDSPSAEEPAGGGATLASRSPKVGEPLGPQAEQIRLLAYTAIGSGCRGLGFWSDRFLADTNTGRDRLLAMALLNQELQMLEPLLSTAEEPFWIDTSSANVKAAVLRCDKAILVLPIWLGGGAQYVPGQSASPVLELTVPHVPTGCQCWEISPGDVHSLHWDRAVGGVKVKLTEFSMTAALVFTSDLSPTGMVVHFQDHQRRVNEQAARWAVAQAQEELRKVELVENELEQAGHRLTDDVQLRARAHSFLDSATAHQRSSEWQDAYADAQRALRPLRIMMRAQWEEAVKKLTAPAASPYALSYYTLPRHWKLWEEVQKRQPGANLLPDGNFEMEPEAIQQGWLRQQSPSLDEVVVAARRVAIQPHEGKQCLMLEVKPKDPLQKPTTLERTYVAVHSPAVKLPPGSLVQISTWARIPSGIAGSADAALFFDSIGGEQMALRLNNHPTWKHYVVYRRVPASGTVHVTMALTGMGAAYFDDVRIEPLELGPTARTVSAANSR